ncbi:GIY-YIG nuclease family protein [Candidatus Dojkabacteria bacterium]|uniref:GIY-YIG nuclease family protein n=1 Tax=Candidatus Dojkabacteria bacterium TaxID=2099670 RepID=A0A955L108_9BACT|nr:GIY-YIG nuclease family protein [Candidatus Dojkabacteria bacterium]
MIYTLYILKCKDKSLYTGITNNIEHRLKMHKSGKGSKYVRAHLPFKLVYSETLSSQSEALKREIEVKKLTRIEKLKLISTK